MTKPANKAQRADEWAFDMPAGLATHLPTGIAFRMYGNWHARLDAPPARPQPQIWEPVDLGEQGDWIYMGMVQLRPGAIDRRPPHSVAPGDANDPRLDTWPILAAAQRLREALEAFTQAHGHEQAKQMLERIARDAGRGWTFRAALERKWGDGRRAT